MKHGKPLCVYRFLDTGTASVGTAEIFNDKGKNVIPGVYMIERPWKKNALGISCIPEGHYSLFQRKSGKYFTAYSKRWNHKYVWQIVDEEVSPRSAILIHSVSDSKQLRGCLAPCTSFTVRKDGVISANGTSRDAYVKLFEAMKKYKTQDLLIENKL